MSQESKTYRVYCFDAALKVVTAEVFEAACDEDALAHAEAMGVRDKCEIWDGNRLVAQIEGERRQA